MKADNENRPSDTHSLTAVAHHEAGHAVFAWLYGVRFDLVTIVSDRESAGKVILSSTKGLLKTKRGWSKFRYGENMMSVAGPVANAIFLGHPYVINGVLQFEANLLFPETDIVTTGWGFPADDTMTWKVHQMIRGRPDIWAAVTGLASLLEGTGTVGWADASRLIRRHIPVKWPKSEIVAA